MALFSKLKSALNKSSGKLTEGISSIFTKRKLDEETLEELEELLIQSDMGVQVSADIIAQLAKQKFGQDVSGEEVTSFLADYISNLLAPAAKPLVLKSGKPQVVLVVGVNGNGKTTTIGKLTSQWKAEGKKVMLAAADTFRAAAAEQLQIWAERCNAPLIRGGHESDPASIAYRAMQEAYRNSSPIDGGSGIREADILLIDTAGRLQNKTQLMEELQKIVRIIQKVDPTAPHHVLQVVDATTGQNAISQVEAFNKMVKVTGLIITKLDGSAKGGIALALTKKFGLPIVYIGVGEGLDDLQPFDYKEFSAALCRK